MSFIYDSCLQDTFRGRLDFENGNFRVLILDDKYQPDKASHTRRSDVQAHEIEGQGYESLETTVSVSMHDGKLKLSLGPAMWQRATMTGHYAVYVHDRGGDAEDDELIGCISLGGPITSTNGEWSLGSSSLVIEN